MFKICLSIVEGELRVWDGPEWDRLYLRDEDLVMRMGDFCGASILLEVSRPNGDDDPLLDAEKACLAAYAFVASPATAQFAVEALQGLAAVEGSRPNDKMPFCVEFIIGEDGCLLAGSKATFSGYSKDSFAYEVEGVSSAEILEEIIGAPPA